MIKIAHRGASGYLPENTLPAFKKAIEMGADAIELDVQVCKSGELVVIHDDKVDRTTNGKGYVKEKTLAELKSLDAGNGEKIPTLQEVFDLVNKRAIINIEIKSSEATVPILKLVREYVAKNGWSRDYFLVSSFDHHQLKKIKDADPRIKICALLSGMPLDFAKFADKLGAEFIGLDREFINQEFVDDAHKRGLKVLVFTTNDPEDIKRIEALNIDGIFSDFPERI